MEKKFEKLIKIDFNTKTTYGDDAKYIQRQYKDSIIQRQYNYKFL